MLLTVPQIADVRSYLDYVELNSSMENLCSRSSDPVVVDSIPAIDIMFSPPSELSASELLTALPSRTKMDQLVAAWFNAADPARGSIIQPAYECNC